MDNIRKFINTYSGTEKERLSVNSNGKEGDDWQDVNAPFREQVCIQIIEKGITASSLLLKDLFRAEAEYSREVWGASPYLSALGKQLLQQTQAQYIEDYLIGKHESFDTDCAVSLGDVEAELLTLILAEMSSSNIEFTEASFTRAEAIEYLQDYCSNHPQ